MISMPRDCRSLGLVGIGGLSSCCIARGCLLQQVVFIGSVKFGRNRLKPGERVGVQHALIASGMQE